MSLFVVFLVWVSSVLKRSCIYVPCVMARSQTAERTASHSIERALSDAANNDLAGASCPTITPSGVFWLRKAKRRMLGEERMAIQGIVHYSRELNQYKLNHLAGEAMNAASTIPTIVSAEGCF